MESLGSGNITLSYDYAAPGRFVEHGVNGYKVPVGEREQFIEAARDIARGTDHSPLRLAARKTATNLSWERVIAAFELNLRNLALNSHNIRSLNRAKLQSASYRSVFISDVHLGGEDSKVKEVVHFLKNITCEHLYLNGDIIDGWALRRGGQWQKKHTRFLRTILTKVEKEDVKVTYIRGNHDEILDRFLPLQFGTFQLKKEAIHTGVDGKKYLIVHGDGFDSISTKHKWVAMLGAVGYDLLLRINRLYNRYRRWHGKEYYSISKLIRARVKSAVTFADAYQDILREHAQKKQCDGIICGHVHTPADQEVNGVRYLNSGDWVESLSAVVEHHDGRFEIIYYEDFVLSLIAEQAELDKINAEYDRALSQS